MAAAGMTLAKPAVAQRATAKRIGFVDDQLDNYHANVFLNALRGPLKSRGFTLAGCTALKEPEGRAWAAKNNVPYFANAKTLNEAVDFFMVIAPSTPGTHLSLCRQVLPFGKPTYVDKTFAPDHATAQQIFALADQHGVPIQTSSVLRYTNVQEEVRKLAPARVDHIVTWGGGSSFGEYAIHPLELAISIMGPNATGLMRRGKDPRSQLLLNFEEDRTAVVNVYTNSSTPFAASITTSKGTQYHTVDTSRFFADGLSATLDFFQTGKPNIDRRESLLLMRILEAAKDPAAAEKFVPLG